MENEKKINIPDYRKFIPFEDSILRSRISKNRNWAILYLFLCENIQKGKHKFTSKKVSEQIKVSPALAYQMLQELVSLSYMNLIKVKGRVIFIGLKDLIVEEFINEAYNLLKQK